MFYESKWNERDRERESERETNTISTNIISYVIVFFFIIELFPNTCALHLHSTCSTIQPNGNKMCINGIVDLAMWIVNHVIKPPYSLFFIQNSQIVCRRKHWTIAKEAIGVEYNVFCFLLNIINNKQGKALPFFASAYFPFHFRSWFILISLNHTNNDSIFNENREG